MVLINKNHAVSISLAKVYENCIKDIDIMDIIRHKNNINFVINWLPYISLIDVSKDEMIIRLKDDKEDINFGFTGYEWVFSDYIDSLYVKE